MACIHYGHVVQKLKKEASLRVFIFNNKCTSLYTKHILLLPPWKIAPSILNQNEAIETPLPSDLLNIAVSLVVTRSTYYFFDTPMEKRYVLQNVATATLPYIPLTGNPYFVEIILFLIIENHP